MKKLLSISLLSLLALPAVAQGDLLVGKTVSQLGVSKTWTNATGTYTFDATQPEHDLSKLVLETRNTDNIFLLPEGQNGGGYGAEEYIEGNKAVGIQGFYVDMGSTQSVASVYSTWEGAAANAYNIYLLDEVPSLSNLGSPVYTADGLGQYSENTAELPANSKGRYLVFEPTDATNWGWGVKIRSISAYGDISSVTELRISETSVPANSSTTVTVTPLNVIGDALDINAISNLTLTCSDPTAVKISADGQDDGTFSVEGITVGTYTLTATATYNGETVTGEAPIYVTYDWKSETNIAAGKTVYYRWKEDGEDSTNKGENVTDNDNETYYQYNGDWGGGDGWIVIDLGEENDHVVDAVEVYFSNNEVNANTGNNTFKLSFGTSQAELPTEDAVWNPGENWITTSSMNKIQDAYVTYIIPQEEKGAIRYVAYLDANNPKGKPMIGQIYVAGTEMTETSEVKEVTITTDYDYVSTGEKVIIIPLVIDQYGSTMADAPVVVYVNDNAIEGFEYTPEAVGNYSIMAKSGEVASEPLTLHVIADANKAINGNNPDNEILYSASKGGVGLETNPFTQETQWSNDEMGTPLVIVFDTPVDLDLLKFRWEAACPSHYTVTVTRQSTRAGEDDEELVMEVENRGFVMGVNPVDRIYNDNKADGTTTLVGSNATCGNDLTNIKSMIVTPTEKDHGYGLRLLGIDAIGTQSSAEPSGIETLDNSLKAGTVDVVTLQGVVIKRNVNAADALQNLPKGIYVVGGKKVAVK